MPALDPAGLHASFTCRVDDAEAIDCTSPFTATLAAGVDGAHLFVVTAIEPFGRRDPTPPIATWTVDTTGPVVDLVAGPAEPDAASSAAFVFGSAEPGVVFECAVDGGPVAPCRSPFTIDDVTDGPHTVVIRGVDPAGNVSPAPITATWTVDSTLAETTITTAPTGTVGPTSQAFDFASPNLGAAATFECAFDGDAFAACVPPLQHAGADGQRVFLVRAVAPTGAVDPTPALRIDAVDAVAPTITVTTRPDDPTEVTTASIDFVTDEPAALLCTFDGGSSTPCAAPFTATRLELGLHRLDIVATDAVGNVASVEVAWTVFGPVVRAFHTATLLDDATVLVAGGEVGGAVVPTAQRYDTATDQLADTGKLRQARAAHTATLLANGTTLVGGGRVAATTLTASPTGGMATARRDHTATLLDDGRVAIIGGRGVGGPTASVEVYDPAAGTFTEIALSTGRAAHTATKLDDGRVLVIGGVDGSGATLASAEIYDPALDTIAPTGSLATGRPGHSAVLFSSGRVLVHGGTDGGGTVLRSGEAYDPGTGLFSPAEPLPSPRTGHILQALGGRGFALLLGGVDENGQPVLATDLVFMRTGLFQAFNSLTGSIVGARQVDFGGSLYITGTTFQEFE